MARAPAAEGGAPRRRSCAQCGGVLVTSHRSYAGRGESADVLRCRDCGAVTTLAPRSDAERRPAQPGRSRRHLPIDEGPPSNPVIDPELARRLLENLQP